MPKPKNDILDQYEQAMNNEANLRQRLGLKGSSVTVETLKFLAGLLDRIEALEKKR